jgi:hypothetical protein
MSSIPPSLPPSTYAPASSGASTTVSVLSDPEGQLAGLLTGTVIAATATQASNANGVALLMTQLGSLLVKLPQPLPQGATVQLQSLAGSNLLRLISVDGAPTRSAGPGQAAVAISSDAAATANAPPPAASPPTANASAVAPAAQLEVASGIDAVLVYPGAQTIAGIQPGVTFTVRITLLPDVSPPPSAQNQPPVPDQPSVAGQPPPAQGQPSVAGQPSAPNQPGTASQPSTANLSSAANPPAPVQPPSPVQGPAPAASLASSARLADQPGASPALAGAADAAVPESGGAAPATTTTAPAAASSPTIASTDAPADILPSPPPDAPIPPSALPAAQEEGAALVASDPSVGDSAALADDVLADVATATSDGAPVLTGVVAPNSLAGQPLVQTAVGLIAVGASLAPGTRVALTVLDATGQFPATVDRAGTAIDGWSAADDAAKALQQAAPGLAEEILRQLPEPGPRLAPVLIALVSAVQSGNLSAWLGEEPVKALERAGHRDLVDRLERDLGEMKAPTRLSGGGGDWQTMLLPMFLGQRVERIRLTMRRPPEDDEEARVRDEVGTRFLVDVEMSRLGPMQLDGLVKRASRRFDLILRSKQPLPTDLKADIRGIFERSLDGAGLVGKVSFLEAVKFIDVTAAEPSRKPGLTI